jgi:hypothetical protein
MTNSKAINLHSLFNNPINSIFPFADFISMKFTNTVLRFFPLAADMIKLQNYCDNYLNFKIPGETKAPPVYFKAAAPYVLLELNEYPRMEELPDVGTWLQTRELIFAIPIEWYTVDNAGHRHFENWGLTFPFIYIDNPISISIGRQIYGIPKAQIAVLDDPATPYNDPAQPRRIVAYYLPNFPANSPGNTQVFNNRFIEIYQDSVRSPWSMSQPRDLFTVWPRTVANYMSLASAITHAVADSPILWSVPKTAIGALEKAARTFQTFAGTPLGTLKNRIGLLDSPSSERVETFASMIQKGFSVSGKWASEMFEPLLQPRAVRQDSPSPSPFMENLISLKQFPLATDPTLSCYQAIVRSSSKFINVNDVGLLFDPLSGDPSGGWSIRIYDDPATKSPIEPMVELLGIEATRAHGERFSTLKPVFPFWWDLDLSYGGASDLCWRTDDRDWSVDPNTPGKPGVGHHQYLALNRAADKLEVPGPFTGTSDVTIYIMPVKADPTTLAHLCNQLLNIASSPYTFWAAAPYVLAFLTQFRNMKSGDNRTWSDTEVAFVLPAYYYKFPLDSGPCLLPLIEFVNGEWDAITGCEIFGRFDLQSSMNIYDPRQLDHLSFAYKPDPWFYVQAPLMAARTEEVIKSAYSMFGVTKQKGFGAPGSYPIVSPEWTVLSTWMDSVGISPGKLAVNNKFKSFALKQFRDAADTTLACYRSLVGVERIFQPDSGGNPPTGDYIGNSPFETDLTLWVQEYTTPLITLATTLGLKGTALPPTRWPFPHVVTPGGVVHGLGTPGKVYEINVENAIRIQAGFTAGATSEDALA